MVQVPDVRILLPVMGDLRDHGLSLLSAEALAAELVLDLPITVVADNPPLAAAAAAAGVAYNVV